MKSKQELQTIIDRISSADSPVGMDAVYVHALILDKLERLEQRLDRLEPRADQGGVTSTGSSVSEIEGI